MLARRFEKMDPTEMNPRLGLALDLSHFRPDVGQQVVSGTETDAGGPDPEGFLLFPFDVAVTPISFDLMLRGPLLASAKFPNGQLQPYLTIGPTIFVAAAEDAGTLRAQTSTRRGSLRTTPP